MVVTSRDTDGPHGAKVCRPRTATGAGTPTCPGRGSPAGARGRFARSGGRAVGQSGSRAAQPNFGISPTVVDMSITAKAAPCWSATAAKRPNGLSIGPKCSFPPCFFAFSTASSQFGTPK